MCPQLLEYPAALDVDWVAIDRWGRVAVFATGGVGPIPVPYLRANGIIHAASTTVWSLPEICDHEVGYEAGPSDEFVAFARRGFFAFDWSDVHRVTKQQVGEYELMARPLVPIAADAIVWPPALRVALASIQKRSLDFEQKFLHVAALLECVAPVQEWEPEEMTTRNQLRGVLAGFLGTYTSRYSDYDGYWLFGFLVESDEVREIALLGEPGATSTADALAVHLARVKFAEQLQKWKVAHVGLSEATLRIVRSPQAVKRPTSSGPRLGFDLRFHASVVTARGRRFEREAELFVAPHDPAAESRSRRAAKPP